MTAQPFIADLHIHSKYSRATAKNLDLEHLYIWAQKKGITVVGTGDFTHPEWFAELNAKLDPAEPGLFRLKPDIEKTLNDSVPASCQAPVRFVLSCEISNIYKKADRTRKNHNLVFFPDLDCVSRFNARLDAIGNIKSDGRPILGLDARDLLETVLETSTDGYLIPAHIWTPWFSMLGSKSGFDCLTDCFDDLSQYIFAAETGLSSDPEMNWQVSSLDNITLVSNSDAHSPSKLGREANLFNTSLDYFSMREAMEKGDGNAFLGTFEFYPEEGKYHVDGHRKCEVCFEPWQTRDHSGLCPVCGKPLTLGVLHRVEELASRKQGIKPDRAFPFYRLVPLENLLSNLLGVGSQSKKVQQTYHELLDRLGSEFSILHDMDSDLIDQMDIPLLGEAIIRMRENRIHFSPGFDGCYGTLRIFTSQEKDRLLGQRSLFSAFEKRIASSQEKKRPEHARQIEADESPAKADCQENPDKPAISLNEDQQQAVLGSTGHMMIVAGPGTGKTRTLTHKIGHIIQEGANVSRMLAMTFTNKAATEMKDRLETLLDGCFGLPFVGTFHGLGFRLLTASKPDTSLRVMDEKTRRELLKDIIFINDLASAIRVDDLMQWVVAAKQQLLSCTDALEDICPPEQLTAFVQCYQDYEALLAVYGLVDFEDLIFKAVRLLEENSGVCPLCADGFSHIFIDEYQDINKGQYRFVKLLAGNRATLCIIGDPDQSIYGFRGSDTDCFKWFLNDFPDAQTIYLRKNYRSIQTILDISTQVIRINPERLGTGHRRAITSDLEGDKTIRIMQCNSDRAEAVAIGKTIEQMVGGTSFFSIDSGAVDDRSNDRQLSFRDFAVLVRTRSQILTLSEVLTKAGIPCQLVDRKALLDHPSVARLIALFKLIRNSAGFDDLEPAAQLIRPTVSATTAQHLKRWAYGKRLSLEDALATVKRLPIPQLQLSQQQKLFDFIIDIEQLRKKQAGKTVTQTLDALLEETGMNQSIADDREFETTIGRLFEISQRHNFDHSGFLADLALYKDTDVYRHTVEKVSVMTMHAAKGLEFTVVFIAGCEDRLIPYHKNGHETYAEEERRLFYVALTRAMQHLFLTSADVRMINGTKEERELSPFVKDIENRYKQFLQSDGKRNINRAQQQLSLF